MLTTNYGETWGNNCCLSMTQQTPHPIIIAKFGLKFKLGLSSQEMRFVIRDYPDQIRFRLSVLVGDFILMKSDA